MQGPLTEQGGWSYSTDDPRERLVADHLDYNGNRMHNGNPYVGHYEDPNASEIKLGG